MWLKRILFGLDPEGYFPNPERSVTIQLVTGQSLVFMHAREPICGMVTHVIAHYAPTIGVWEGSKFSIVRWTPRQRRLIVHPKP